MTTTKQGGALDEAFVEPVEFQSKGLSHTLLQAPPFGDSKDKVKASSHPKSFLICKPAYIPSMQSIFGHLQVLTLIMFNEVHSAFDCLSVPHIRSHYSITQTFILALKKHYFVDTLETHVPLVDYEDKHKCDT